jgi:electron transfer flavoprotein alpha subunit
METGKDVWVIIEHSDGEIKPVNFEMLNAAKTLAAKTGGKVVAAWLNSDGSEIEDQLAEHGADVVNVFQHADLAKYSCTAYLSALLPPLNIAKPQAIILPATTHGKELAPTLATQLGSGLATDCIAIDFDEAEGLVVKRPVYSGKAISTVRFTSKHNNVLTLRANIFRGSGEKMAGEGKKVSINPDISQSALLIKIREVVKNAGDAIDISEARIIVSGGLGMQGPENFKLIEELAEVLGAAVGASRPVVDDGWRDYSSQVGQTGRTVAPDLYIACGISGAVQHLAGMSSASCIIAINKDPNAAIFSVADYGIVGDALEILPIMTRQFKAALNKSN